MGTLCGRQCSTCSGRKGFEVSIEVHSHTPTHNIVTHHNHVLHTTGMSSPILGVSLQKSTAFGVYGAVKSHLQGDAPFAALYHVTLAGCIGGIANSAILTPVDQLKV